MPRMHPSFVVLEDVSTVYCLQGSRHPQEDTTYHDLQTLTKTLVFAVCGLRKIGSLLSPQTEQDGLMCIARYTRHHPYPSMNPLHRASNPEDHVNPQVQPIPASPRSGGRGEQAASSK